VIGFLPLNPLYDHHSVMSERRRNMTRISEAGGVATLINVFTVAPEDQQHLLDLLVEATESVMKGLPGFVSANLHKSLDGTRVVNYAQWRSREDFEAMLSNPEAAVHMEEAGRIAEKFEPHLYEVSFIHEAPGS
jgi:heme-degrading monooxygenase HmoA